MEQVRKQRADDDAADVLEALYRAEYGGMVRLAFTQPWSSTKKVSPEWSD
ncbi:MAG: hypothetical protein ACLGHQ_08845 [Acidimicrobiia bacterium]